MTIMLEQLPVSEVISMIKVVESVWYDPTGSIGRFRVVELRPSIFATSLEHVPGIWGVDFKKPYNGSGGGLVTKTEDPAKMYLLYGNWVDLKNEEDLYELIQSGMEPYQAFEVLAL